MKKTFALFAVLCASAFAQQQVPLRNLMVNPGDLIVGGVGGAPTLLPASAGYLHWNGSIFVFDAGTSGSVAFSGVTAKPFRTVTDFGAGDPTGVASSSTIFQACANSYSSGNGECWVPGGIWNLGTTVTQPAGVTITWHKDPATTITGTGLPGNPVTDALMPQLDGSGNLSVSGNITSQGLSITGASEAGQALVATSTAGGTAWGPRPESVLCIESDYAVISNTETDLVNCNVNANYIGTGSSIKFKIGCLGTTASATPGTYTVNVRFGASNSMTDQIVVGSTTPTLNTSITTKPFTIEGFIQWVNNGAATGWLSNMDIKEAANAAYPWGTQSTVPNVVIVPVTGAVLTGANTFHITFQSSVSGSSAQCGPAVVDSARI